MLRSSQNIPNKSDGIIKTWQGGEKEPMRKESNFILTFNRLNIRTTILKLFTVTADILFT